MLCPSHLTLTPPQASTSALLSVILCTSPPRPCSPGKTPNSVFVFVSALTFVLPASVWLKCPELPARYLSDIIPETAINNLIPGAIRCNGVHSV